MSNPLTTEPGSVATKPASRLSSIREPEKPDSPETPAKKKFPIIYFVPIALMGIGYAVGGFFIKAAPKDNHGDHVAEHHDDPTIDQKMVEQRWKEALQKIRESLATAQGKEQLPLKFREAICSEMSKDFPTASKLYGEIYGREPQTVRGIAARISWARCQLAMKRIPEAKAALSRLLLTSPDDGSKNTPLNADLLATLAHAEVLSSEIKFVPDPFDPLMPAVAEKEANLEQLLTWAGALKLASHGQVHGHDAGDISHGSGHDSHSTHAPTSKDHAEHPTAKDSHAEDGHAPEKPKDAHAKDEHDEHLPKKNDALKGEHGKETSEEHATKVPSEHADHVNHDSPPISLWKHLGELCHPTKDDHAVVDTTPSVMSFWKRLASLKGQHSGPKNTAKKSASPEGTLPTKKEVVDLEAKTKPEDRRITKDIQSRSVAELVNEIAQDLHLKVKIEQGVEDNLSGRSSTIRTNRLPANQLLDALLNPVDVEWKIVEDILVLRVLTNEPEAVKERIQVAVNRLLSLEQDHPWRMALMIDWANQEYLAKRWRKASEIYAKAMDEGFHRPEAVVINYNLGMVYSHLGQRDRARDQFQSLADRDLLNRWTPIAYYWMGRTHLDVNEPAFGIKYFENAIQAEGNEYLTAASVLGLAFCHLMREDYSSAHATIRPYAKILKAPAVKTISSFVDALCRYHLAENPTATGEAEDLLYATLNCGEDSIIGPAGMWVIGKSCRQLGFGPRMVKMFDHVLSTLRGGLAIRMTSELADYHFKEGDPAKAMTAYQAIAAVNRDEPGKDALVQLARLSLKANQPNDAVKYSRLALRIGVDQSLILKELGKAYEMKKDFTRAAKCFAGEVPE